MAVNLIGQAPLFLDVVRQMPAIARIDAPVLVEGETGTGKELVARALHYSGPRHAMPFIPVNCGGLPESLIENEFFGHCRGAYTDAREPRPGLIAQAHGGTLFLDEVDALPLHGQVALLRFLQDFRYRPLGSAIDQRADVRVVASTNLDLDELVRLRQFRPDLLYRLRIFSLALPPLRKRPGDPELLADHFVRIYSGQYKLPLRPLASSNPEWIARHSWPGNVRELENLVHRAVVWSQTQPHIDLEAMLTGTGRDKASLRDVSPSLPAAELRFQQAKAEAIHAFERSFIERVLTACRGNVSAAARLSGKERRAFGRLMKKHGFTSRQFAEQA